MKYALLVAILHAAGFGMTWWPFQTCDETHQVDSIRTTVWIEESLDSALAPYHGSARFRYHPGTCFVAKTEQRPYFMDTLIVVEAALSADGRRQDFRWPDSGPVELQPHGTKWFSTGGELDSTHYHSYAINEDEPPLQFSERVVRIRTAQSLVIINSVRSGEEDTWTEVAKDSVVQSGGVTMVYTVDVDGSWETRCAAEGSTYVCTPTPIGDVSDDRNKQVWHLTGNRPDSLRTYRPDGTLESTDYWSWSSRAMVSVRRQLSRARPRSIPAFQEFNLLGRALPE